MVREVLKPQFALCPPCVHPLPSQVWTLEALPDKLPGATLHLRLCCGCQEWAPEADARMGFWSWTRRLPAGSEESFTPWQAKHHLWHKVTVKLLKLPQTGMMFAGREFTRSLRNAEGGAKNLTRESAIFKHPLELQRLGGEGASEARVDSCWH